MDDSPNTSHLTHEKTATTVESANSNEGQFVLKPAETYQTSYEQAVEGALYRDGQLILQPAATRAPRDPLNLPLWRKVCAIFFLSFFGALIASAELILGAALPVFVLQYAGQPASLLVTIAGNGGFPLHSNPLQYLEDFKGPPVFDVYLLASLPLLVIGVSNLILVPVAIAVGRRPVIIATGLLAIAGASWAGNSQSLGSHIGARCVQAIGAGSVESLIPFIIQDIVHVHQRNTWISAAFAAQGVIIIAIGFATPWIIINLSWRWVYFITAICGAFFLIGIFFFLPETRWARSRSEINGVPRNDEDTVYEPRSYVHDLALWHGPQNWQKGWHAFLDVLRTFFYPQIFFVTVLNSGFIGAGFGAGLTAAPALLTAPWNWPFYHLGFCLVAVLIAAILVAIITGGMADYFANWLAKQRGKRMPENQLINLILPACCGIIGSVLYGVSGQFQEDYNWPVFLFALACIAFGFLGANSIGAVYVLECFPHLAGPALVNIASFRYIIAFFITFEVSDWVIDLGYLKTFMIYTGIIAGLSLTIPIVYYYGPAWRARLPAHSIGSKREEEDATV